MSPLVVVERWPSSESPRDDHSGVSFQHSSDGLYRTGKMVHFLIRRFFSMVSSRRYHFERLAGVTTSCALDFWAFGAKVRLYSFKVSHHYIFYGNGIGMGHVSVYSRCTAGADTRKLKEFNK